MKFVVEMLEIPFWRLRWEQQFLLVSIFIGCLWLVGWSLRLATRRLSDRRGDGPPSGPQQPLVQNASMPSEARNAHT